MAMTMTMNANQTLRRKPNPYRHIRRPSKPISFPAETEKKGLPNTGTSQAESSPVQERSRSEPDLSKVEIRLKDMVQLLFYLLFFQLARPRCVQCNSLSHEGLSTNLFDCV